MNTYYNQLTILTNNINRTNFSVICGEKMCPGLCNSDKSDNINRDPIKQHLLY